ncbi:unnamed protein product [Caenorhabditis bovis]|uniref:Uncharacterized protein n=1 Tax=Caenorhabditis bovis TaxID=2654633 RepID=A0A8S1F988_9PELO|nr:unnamed protein product [Caenorhabditis bovis]
MATRRYRVVKADNVEDLEAELEHAIALMIRVKNRLEWINGPVKMSKKTINSSINNVLSMKIKSFYHINYNLNLPEDEILLEASRQPVPRCLAYLAYPDIESPSTSSGNLLLPPGTISSNSHSNRSSKNQNTGNKSPNENAGMRNRRNLKKRLAIQ